MPAAPKTSDVKIVAAARKLVDKYGHDGFAMADVAAAVGIRAPSLYGRFPTKTALLAAIEVDLWADVARALVAVRAREPAAALAGIARAYRKFAKAHPRGFALMADGWTTRGDAAQPARAATFAVAVPHLVALVGERDALHAGRLVTAFLHGFVAMELAGAFRLGGSVDAAFDYGLRALVDGLARQRRA